MKRDQVFEGATMTRGATETPDAGALLAAIARELSNRTSPDRLRDAALLADDLRLPNEFRALASALFRLADSEERWREMKRAELDTDLLDRLRQEAVARVKVAFDGAAQAAGFRSSRRGAA